MSEHIQKWQSEHANYRQLLRLLSSETAHFVDDQEPDYDLMSDIVYYITQYPERFHHPREDVAFKRLLAHDPRLHGLIREMNEQHREISERSAMLGADLNAVSSGAIVPRRRLEADVREYVSVLENHLDTEEREIFPRLAAALGDTDWFLVDSVIHFAADPLFDGPVHERFRKIHRGIANRAHCGCPEPREGVCCLD